MKNKMKWMLAIGLLSCSMAMAQQQSDILSVSASANAENAALSSEEHTSELQSPLIISYAVFCLKKKK